MNTTAPPPAPLPASEAPKPANPEPTAAPVDPEKRGVTAPPPGQSEHPRQ